jgi:hypothetical protein
MQITNNELTVSGNNKALVKVDHIETGGVPAAPERSRVEWVRGGFKENILTGGNRQGAE